MSLRPGAGTPPGPRLNLSSIFSNTRDLALAAGVVAVVLMMMIPLPTVLLDTLMASNLILSLLILLVALYTRKATDFSVFPTLLLVITVFGIALNVSSTRLILGQGAAFNGRMIRAFASFVVGSGGTEGLVIGLIIFIVIIAVQMIVITKGATRISEVAARFTLDKMPTKQMAIEAELNSGAITEEEAKLKKEEVEKESGFYGSMDGASKFVSGNVKFGILVTLINIIGGMIIGITLHGEDISQVAGTYIAFAIGDGLLTQFPALLVSVASGLLVTRSVSNGTFSEDVSNELSKDERIFFIGAAVLLLFALLPGFPWYILIPMSALLAFAGWRIHLSNTKKAALKAGGMAGLVAKKPEKTGEAEVSAVTPLEPLTLELGYGLVPLVDKEKGAELLERIHRVRRETALDMGLKIPSIRIIDNMRLDSMEYCFKIKGMDVGRGKIRASAYLCILPPGGVQEEIEGEKTREPAFGLPAVWVSEDKREEAERAGYTVIDPPSLVATHLTEIIKRHGAEILGRQETDDILSTLADQYPAVVKEVREGLSLGQIQKVFQNLLSERVSIRNYVSILETLADYAKVTKYTWVLTEKARQALGRQICLQYATEDPDTGQHSLHVLTLEQQLEQKINDSRVEDAGGVHVALEPGARTAFTRALNKAMEGMQNLGYIPVILCSEATRPLVKQLTAMDAPALAVLSVPEIAMDMKVESIGVIRE
ncbi:MAG: flagellar biosynthesis protein FlhA [Spirochaetaceae bacterium]|nr:flagellar biosynthesis protein FlhA [Spirochaetaceae bacterium]